MRKRARKKCYQTFSSPRTWLFFRWWELEMEELWRHWAMKFSFAPKVFFCLFFFFSLQGFIMQNVSCSQTKADQRASRLRITITPTSVLACSSENSFRQVVQTAVLIQDPLCNIYKWMHHIKNNLIFNSFTSFLAAVCSPSLCPVHKKIFTFQVFHFRGFACLVTVTFYHQRGMTSLSPLYRYPFLPLYCVCCCLEEAIYNPHPHFFFFLQNESLLFWMTQATETLCLPGWKEWQVDLKINRVFFLSYFFSMHLFDHALVRGGWVGLGDDFSVSYLQKKKNRVRNLWYQVIITPYPAVIWRWIISDVSTQLKDTNE